MRYPFSRKKKASPVRDPRVKVQVLEITGAPLAHFMPLKTFHSPDFQCDYVKGQKYTLREGADLLKTLLPGWETEGKIKWL